VTLWVAKPVIIGNRLPKFIDFGWSQRHSRINNQNHDVTTQSEATSSMTLKLSSWIWQAKWRWCHNGVTEDVVRSVVFRLREWCWLHENPELAILSLRSHQSVHDVISPWRYTHVSGGGAVSSFLCRNAWEYGCYFVDVSGFINFPSGRYFLNSTVFSIDSYFVLPANLALKVDVPQSAGDVHNCRICKCSQLQLRRSLVQTLIL
jgi:hypothetical protein